MQTENNGFEHIRKMREKYFSTGSFEGIEGIREPIRDCWEQYYNDVIVGRKTEKQKVSARELEAAREKSSDLLKVASPYMKLLHSFLEQDGFFVTLMDSDGVILKIEGDSKMLGVAASTGLEEGSFRGEGSYPALFSMCRKLDRPFQIVSCENPSSLDDDLAGSAAPIHERNTGRPLGVIGISGYWWNSHSHTLGLAIMAAEAISQQLELRQKNKDIRAINSSLDLALESIDSGIIYFNSRGEIRAVNRQAIELLVKTKESIPEFKKRNFISLFAHTAIPSLADICREIDDRGSYTTTLVPSERSSRHISIRRVAGTEDEFLAEIRRSSEFGKTIAEAVYSNSRITFDDIIGRSPAIESVKHTAEIAMRHCPTILITGESGTGKELFAQAIHNGGPRARGPFIAINCGAIPRSLLESELFGYEDGAFTGARKGGYQGKFELADKGTIFLDEIGDMPYETQISLLRVLQNKQFMRIGGSRPIKTDVNIIAATNQDLLKKIADKSFREDLYYRLNVFSIHLPRLCDRMEDIGLLTEYFIEKYSTTLEKDIRGISSTAMEMLRAHNWPGNVRELENAIERAAIICQGTRIEASDLPENLRRENAPTTSGNKDFSLEEMLAKHRGNLSAVAAELGISRPTLYRRLKAQGLYSGK
ncbi:MAG: sigma 54-interacting transcriptional regulator [Spirochaetales bacterium]|nr:sigma 54-interacting transcriptional regulator [Spirochaetales bacterium]